MFNSVSLSLSRARALSPSMRLHFLTLSHSLTHYTCEHTHIHTHSQSLSSPDISAHCQSVSHSQGISFQIEGRWKKLYFKKKLLLEIHCLFPGFTILLGRAQAVEQNASKRWVRMLKLKVSCSCGIQYYFTGVIHLIIIINNNIYWHWLLLGVFPKSYK